MREGKIILPQNDNAGKPIRAVHRRMTREIVTAFGGMTETDGFGSWIDDQGELDNEPVTIYTVAAENTAENNYALERIAHTYGRAASQKAIYWAGFDGNAHIDNL